MIRKDQIFTKDIKNGFLLALIGASFVLGACSSTNISEKPSTATPATTKIPITSVTTTPEIYDVTFLAFHDYDGNGIMEKGEPALAGILNKTCAGECTTGVDGTCTVKAPAGNNLVFVTDTRDVETFEKMRFIPNSISEVRTTRQGLDFTADEEETVQVPLGQGFLTWPLYCATKGEVSYFFDVQSGNGCKYWNQKYVAGTCADGHEGTDIEGLEGSIILASAPGYVQTGQNDAGALWIDIRTFENSDQGRHIGVHYGHIKEYKVKSGDFVHRGQPIALLGKTGTKHPHIHFSLSINDHWIDIYRDVSNPTSLNYWIIDNNPVCLPP
ncbi:MAG: M23 family metallopeptidase [Anaerolineaceae bacterium]